MTEYGVRTVPGTNTVRVSRPGGVSRVRTRLLGVSRPAEGAAGRGGAGVWAVTRDAGLALDSARSQAPLGDVSAFPYFFDSAAGGFLKGADGVVRCYQVGGPSGEMVVSTVTDDNPLGAPYQSVTVTGAPMNWVGGGPIIDLGGGEGLMILHVEDEYGPSTVSWNYWTFGAAKVVDVGGGVAPTVTWLGSLFRHEMTPEFSELYEIVANLGSGHILTYDGDVYLYHLDYDAVGTAHGAVSRCSLADITAAVAANVAPEFVKWNGEALTDPWTEPALGGASATNSSLEAVSDLGDIVELPDGRWLWMAARPAAENQIEWSVGQTPLLWSPVDVLETDTANDDEWVYSLLWSGDPDSPKVLTRETAEFYFVAGTRWTDTRVEKITLRPVVSTDFARGTTYLHTGGTTLDMADVPTSTETVVLAVPTTTVVMPFSPTWTGRAAINIYNATGDPVTVTAAGGDVPIAGSGDITIPATTGKAEMFLIDSVPLWSGIVTDLAGGSAAANIEVDLAGAIAEDLPGYLLSNASDGNTVLIPLDQEGVRVLCVVYMDPGFIENDANKGKVYVVGPGPSYALTETGEQLDIGGIAVATAETWDPGTDDELLGVAAKLRGAIFMRGAEPYGIEIAAVGEFTRRIAVNARNLTINSDNPTAEIDDFVGMAVCDPASNGGNLTPTLFKLLYRPGAEVHFLRTTAGTVTITAAAGELIDGASTYVMTARYARLRNLRSSWTVVESNDIADLYGVSITSPTAGQVFTFDGVNWINDDPAAASAVGLVQPVRENGTTRYDWVPAVLTGGVANYTIAAHSHYFPFVLQEEITIDRLRCNVQTGAAAGKLLQMGLWAANSDFQPASVIYKSSTIAADSTGEKTATPASALVLPPGAYLAIFASDGTPVMRYYPTQQPYLPLISGTDMTQAWHGWVRSGTPTLPLSDTPGNWNAAFGGGWGHNRCFITFRVTA